MTWIPVVSNVLLGLLVFGLSASVDVLAFKQKLKNKNGILIGLACQFLLLPFVGYVTIEAFALKEVYGISLLVVCSSPGGSYSNLWCSLFNADLALSVAMTTASTMVAAVMLPVNLIIYLSLIYNESGAHQHLDWAALFTSIGVVIVAVAAGLTTSSYASEYVQSKCALFGNLAGLCLILFSAAVSSRDEPIWDKPGLFYIAIATPCLVALLLALSLTSLPSCGLAKPERVSVAIETCYQNVGVATAVALSMFKGKEQAQAVGVPLYYGLVEAVLLAIFCVAAWKGGWTLAPARARDVLKIRPEGEGAGGGGCGPLGWIMAAVVATQLEIRALRVILSGNYQQRLRSFPVVTSHTEMTSCNSEGPAAAVGGAIDDDEGDGDEEGGGGGGRGKDFQPVRSRPPSASLDTVVPAALGSST